MPQPQAWQQDINRTNLQIARGNLSLTSMDATRRVCKSNAKQIDKVKLWEAGEAYPTYRQMEALANIYNVNVLQFFVTERLAATKVLAAFRSDASRQTGYNLHRFIDILRVRQKIISRSMQDDGFEKHELAGSGSDYEDPIRLSRLIREKIGYEPDPEDVKRDAIAHLRMLLHKQRIFVFKTLSMRPVEVAEMKGMYLHDEYAPCIAINRRDHKNSQLFSLAHEIAHLFRADERVDSIEFRHLDGIHDKEETFCNRVAADLLMPADSIPSPPAGAYSLEDVKDLAEEYQVSNQVSLFRLSALGYIPRGKLAEFRAQLAKEYAGYSTNQSATSKPGKSGGNYYNNMRDSNGALFDEFVFSLHIEGRLNAVEAQNLLKMPLTEVKS